MNKASAVKHSMFHIHQQNIKVGRVEHATKKKIELRFEGEANTLRLYCCFVPFPRQISPNPGPYLHI
jgi:hypothetical protein